MKHSYPLGICITVLSYSLFPSLGLSDFLSLPWFLCTFGSPQHSLRVAVSLVFLFFCVFLSPSQSVSLLQCLFSSLSVFTLSLPPIHWDVYTTPTFFDDPHEPSPWASLTKTGTKTICLFSHTFHLLILFYHFFFIPRVELLPQHYSSLAPKAGNLVLNLSILNSKIISGPGSTAVSALPSFTAWALCPEIFPRKPMTRVWPLWTFLGVKGGGLQALNRMSLTMDTHPDLRSCPAFYCSLIPAPPPHSPLHVSNGSHPMPWLWAWSPMATPSVHGSVTGGQEQSTGLGTWGGVQFKLAFQLHNSLFG